MKATRIAFETPGQVISASDVTGRNDTSRKRRSPVAPIYELGTRFPLFGPWALLRREQDTQACNIVVE